MQPRDYYITGGAGFIGSVTAAALLARPETRRVTVIDNFSSGREWHLAECAKDSRFRLVRGDLLDLPLVRDSMAGHDTVFHFASNPDIAKAATDPDIDFRQGTELTRNVIESVRRCRVERVLYTSGSGIYGDLGETLMTEDLGPLVPVSTYAASKIAGEGLVCAYSHMFGMQSRIFRFANVVGGHQTHGVGYDFMLRLHSDPTRLRISAMEPRARATSTSTTSGRSAGSRLIARLTTSQSSRCASTTRAGSLLIRSGSQSRGSAPETACWSSPSVAATVRRTSPRTWCVRSSSRKRSGQRSTASWAGTAVSPGRPRPPASSCPWSLPSGSRRIPRASAP